MKRFPFVIMLSFLVSGISLQAQEASSGMELSLEDCIRMTSTGNVRMKNSHLDYMSANMLKREALSYYFPTIDLKGVGFSSVKPLVRIGVNDILGSSELADDISCFVRTLADMSGLKSSYEALKSAYGAAVTLFQPVYAGGRIVNNNRLARLGVKAASLNESIARRDILTDVEKKYWLAVSLEQKMKMVEKGLELADKLYEDALSAYTSGLVTDNELEKVRKGQQDLKAKRIRLKGGIMLAKMDLCNAVGIESTEALTLRLTDRLIECSSPETYYKDPAEVVGALEEAQLLEMAVQQKELEKKIAMGEALPQVGLGASYSYGSLIGSPQDNGAIYATIKIPLTDWAKVGSRMKNIDYQKEKASNQREYLQRMLELQLRQLWVEVESTWEELCLKDEDVAIARELLAQTQADVLSGLSTASVLLEKQLALSKAQCEQEDARIAYRNAVAAFSARCKN